MGTFFVPTHKYTQSTIAGGGQNKNRFAHPTLTDMVVEAAPQSHEDFAAFMRNEATRWAQVVKDAGIPAQ